jgi:hypothetical protein
LFIGNLTVKIKMSEAKQDKSEKHRKRNWIYAAILAGVACLVLYMFYVNPFGMKDNTFGKPQEVKDKKIAYINLGQIIIADQNGIEQIVSIPGVNITDFVIDNNNTLYFIDHINVNRAIVKSCLLGSASSSLEDRLIQIETPKVISDPNAYAVKTGLAPTDELVQKIMCDEDANTIYSVGAKSIENLAGEFPYFANDMKNVYSISMGNICVQPVVKKSDNMIVLGEAKPVTKEGDYQEMAIGNDIIATLRGSGNGGCDVFVAQINADAILEFQRHTFSGFIPFRYNMNRYKKDISISKDGSTIYYSVFSGTYRKQVRGNLGK